MRVNWKIVVLSAILAIAGCAGQSQGAFQNLDFEAARLPISDQILLVPVTDALPGWSVSIGNVEQTSLYYNSISLGAPNVSVLHSNFFYGSAITAIDGNFSALLQAGYAGTNFYPALISQTGLVPVEAQIIEAKIVTGSLDFTFSLNGTPINMIPVVTNASYTLYGGDISSFAGQSATLTITAPPTQLNPTYGIKLDSIVFSPVPEPSMAVLTFTAAVLLRLFRRRTRNGSSPLDCRHQ